jgi:DNA-directed RNA polymerase subunit RPC12/RpoP
MRSEGRGADTMAIWVQCKSCGTFFRAKEEWTGKRAKCTYCGHIIIIKRASVAMPPAGKRADEKDLPKPKPPKAAPEPMPSERASSEEKREPPPSAESDRQAGQSRETYEIKVEESPSRPAAPGKTCAVCGVATLTLRAIEEEDAARREAARQGTAEYEHGFYKALCAKQGYRCVGCGRISCEKCLMEGRSRKTNIENILCPECGGKLEIRR